MIAFLVVLLGVLTSAAWYTGVLFNFDRWQAGKSVRVRHWLPFLVWPVGLLCLIPRGIRSVLQWRQNNRRRIAWENAEEAKHPAASRHGALTSGNKERPYG